MATISSTYSGNLKVDYVNDTVNIAKHDGSAKGLKLADVLVTATAGEINQQCDASANTETVIAAGAVSITKPHTSLALVGAGAVTLAAPSVDGVVKIICMTVDNGDVTLALTNVVGASAATTCTFNDANDTIVLVSSLAHAKWIMLKEVGVTVA